MQSLPQTRKVPMEVHVKPVAFSAIGIVAHHATTNASTCDTQLQCARMSASTYWYKQFLEHAQPQLWKWSKEVQTGYIICVSQSSRDAYFCKHVKARTALTAGCSGQHMSWNSSVPLKHPGLQQHQSLVTAVSQFLSVTRIGMYVVVSKRNSFRQRRTMRCFNGTKLFQLTC